MDVLSAILDKYGDPSAPVSDSLDALKAKKVLISLQSCGIATAGEEQRIWQLSFPRLTELDLSRNALAWEEVAKLFEFCNMPRLAVLNVGFNPLSTLAPLEHAFDCFSALSTLVLDGTKASFHECIHLITKCPRLTELSVSENEYGRLEVLGDVEVLPALTTLRLGNNYLCDWKDIMVLGTMFPSLTTLVLSGNPLSKLLPELHVVFVSTFPNLSTVNLANTAIEDFETVKCFGRLPSLRAIRLSNCPFPVPEPDVLRMLLIASLPNVASGGGGLQTVGSETAGLLNGSAVTRMERRGMSTH